MSPLNIEKIIDKKNLNQRQVQFVIELVKRGGSFTNAKLAEIWGTKTFPKNFKDKLLEEPSILQKIPGKTQKFKVVSDQNLSLHQLPVDNIIDSKTEYKHPIGVKTPNIDVKLLELEDRINKLEKQFQVSIPVYEEVSFKRFKEKLYNIYQYLNPSNDLSGIDYDNLKRRVCRDLNISFGYFEDLVYDLQRKEQRINFQHGRGKKYIHIKVD